MEVVMSRAYKKNLIDETDDLSAGTLNTTATERLSGADLEQLRLSALNGAAAAVDANAVKTVGTNAAHGAKSNAALTGADLERFAGDQ
jgi:hypothetical protein